MNKENLKKLLKLTETINPENFSMSLYRESWKDCSTPKCNSVGCLIGYATILDSKNVVKNFLIGEEIEFLEWSEEFFEIDSDDDDIWRYLFHGEWGFKPETNTLEQAKIRIQKVLNGFNPETDWDNEYTLQTL